MGGDSGHYAHTITDLPCYCGAHAYTNSSGIRVVVHDLTVPSRIGKEADQ